MTLPPLNISFSGGRTSGYMTKKLMDKYRGQREFIVVFANTGMEHEKTLDFVHNCDRHFGFNTVWVEAIAHHGQRKSSGHKVVTYETASRNGEPFEDHIKKYGIPNVAFPACTRELKLNAMNSYVQSRGYDLREIPTAIGIRADEKRRVRKDASDYNIVYPLVDEFPTDKQDVLDWWEDQEFDLGIEEFEGNCKGCFKKSIRKQFMQIAKDPSVFDWHRRMEQRYRTVGLQYGERVFFRGNKDTNALFAEYAALGGSVPRNVVDPYENGGCSESCEFLPTDDSPAPRDWTLLDLFGAAA